MANAKRAHLLQFVCGPMTEVQRARRPRFKRVTALHDMSHMMLRRAFNQALDCAWITQSQGIGMRLNPFHKVPVTNQTNLQRFDVTVPQLPVRQRIEEIIIVNHRMWHGKRSDEILLAVRIDTIFHTNAAVPLAESGGRHTNQTNPPMCRCGRIPHQIKQGASTDCDDVTMPTQLT